jgi:hypothetical protein
MLIRKRVAVLAVDCNRVVYDLHRERVQPMLAAGLVRVESLNAGGAVAVVRMTAQAVPLSFRPGSYGINRQHVPVGNQYGLSGGVVFSHRRTHERALAA